MGDQPPQIKGVMPIKPPLAPSACVGNLSIFAAHLNDESSKSIISASLPLSKGLPVTIRTFLPSEKKVVTMS